MLVLENTTRQRDSSDLLNDGLGVFLSDYLGQWGV
jgi:hypothetical protein